MNSPETLKALRTTYRVPQPSTMNHRLIRTARRVCGVPIYCYKTKKRLDVGNAPQDTFYEKGRLYLGPRDQRRPLGVWHDLCHVMVAEKAGKLNEFNFASNQSDETLTCKIEFWLGFVTSYYSYRSLIKNLFDYNFSDYLTFKLEDKCAEKDPGTWVTSASVEGFLRMCRKEALKVPLACKVARELGVYSEKTLRDRMRPFRA